MKNFRQYRAWHKKLNKMLYPPHEFDSMTDCRDSDGNHVVCSKTDMFTYNFQAIMTWDGRWYMEGKYQDVIWMQYIGSDTKDSKEIYEQDILKYNGDDVRFKGKIGVVRFEPDNGGYILEFEWSKNQHHLMLNCDVAYSSEKLGNIYQNPEFLK